MVRHRHDSSFRKRSWNRKFSDALRGARRGIRGQSSFFVHFFATAAVVAAAWVLKADLVDWCLLLLCITTVLAAEMFNSALEAMSKSINLRPHAHLRDALDIGSAAVLTASAGAALVGGVVFLHRVAALFGW